MKRVHAGSGATHSAQAEDLHGYGPSEQARILHALDRQALARLGAPETRDAFFAFLRESGASVASPVEIDAAFVEFANLNLVQAAHIAEHAEPGPAEDARRSVRDLVGEFEAAAKLESAGTAGRGAVGRPSAGTIRRATEAMFQAIEAGSTEDLRRALTAGALPAAFLSWSNPVSDGDLELLVDESDRFLSGAADADAHVRALINLLDIDHHPSRNGYNAVTYACFHGNVQALRLLCAAARAQGGSLLDAEDGLGCTPLTVALATGRSDCVGVLLDEGADINRVNGRGRSPLAVACAKGNSAAIFALLERGARTLASRPGNVPLALALTAAQNSSDAEMEAACLALLHAGAAESSDLAERAAAQARHLDPVGDAFVAFTETLQAFYSGASAFPEFKAPAHAAFLSSCRAAVASWEFPQRRALQDFLLPLSQANPDLVTDCRAGAADLPGELAAMLAATTLAPPQQRLSREDRKLEQSPTCDCVLDVVERADPASDAAAMEAAITFISKRGNLADLSKGLELAVRLPERTAACCDRLGEALPRRLDQLLDALPGSNRCKALCPDNAFAVDLVFSLLEAGSEAQPQWLSPVIASFCRRTDWFTLVEFIGRLDSNEDALNTLIMTEIDRLADAGQHDGEAFLQALSVIDAAYGDDPEEGYTERRFAVLDSEAKRHVLLHGMRWQTEFVMDRLAEKSQDETRGLWQSLCDGGEQGPPSSGISKEMAMAADRPGRLTPGESVANALARYSFEEMSLDHRLRILAFVNELDAVVRADFIAALPPSNAQEFARWLNESKD